MHSPNNNKYYIYTNLDIIDNLTAEGLREKSYIFSAKVMHKYDTCAILQMFYPE